MNVGEYGLSFDLYVQFDISAFTTLSLTVTRPDGTSFTRTGGLVTAPGTDVQTSMGRFPAHQYAHYIVQNGDLNQAGQYQARLTYDDAAGQHLISSETVPPAGKFTVDQ